MNDLLDELNEFYNGLKLDIYIAVHVACGIDIEELKKNDEPVPMEQLFSHPVNTNFKKTGKSLKTPPDFLAYVTSGYVKPLEDLP